MLSASCEQGEASPCGPQGPARQAGAGTTLFASVGVFVRDSETALRSPHAPLTHSNCDPGMLNPPVPGGEAAWASGALRMRRPGRKARFGFTASFLSLRSWLPFTRWSVPRSSPCPIAWGSVQKGWPGPHLGKDGVGPLPQPRGWNMAWLCPTGGEDLSHRTILAPIHVPLD